MRDLLNRMNIQGFVVDSYFSDSQNDLRNLPNIGIAASGGGYRALLNGAGVLEAFDVSKSIQRWTWRAEHILMSTPAIEPNA